MRGKNCKTLLFEKGGLGQLIDGRVGHHNVEDYDKGKFLAGEILEKSIIKQSTYFDNQTKLRFARPVD